MLSNATKLKSVDMESLDEMGMCALLHTFYIKLL